MSYKIKNGNITHTDGEFNPSGIALIRIKNDECETEDILYISNTTHNETGSIYKINYNLSTREFGDTITYYNEGTLESLNSINGMTHLNNKIIFTTDFSDKTIDDAYFHFIEVNENESYRFFETQHPKEDSGSMYTVIKIFNDIKKLVDTEYGLNLNEDDISEMSLHIPTELESINGMTIIKTSTYSRIIICAKVKYNHYGLETHKYFIISREIHEDGDGVYMFGDYKLNSIIGDDIIEELNILECGCDISNFEITNIYYDTKEKRLMYLCSYLDGEEIRGLIIYSNWNNGHGVPCVYGYVKNDMANSNQALILTKKPKAITRLINNEYIILYETSTITNNVAYEILRIYEW
jgi:hypothetical protein